MFNLRCPNCKVIYRYSAPNICSLCKNNLATEIKKVLKKETNKKELYEWIEYNENKIKKHEDEIKNEQIRIKEEIKKIKLSKLKCSTCRSKNLEMINAHNCDFIYIRCNNCGNFDTRECYDDTKEKFGKIIRCKYCSSSTTQISSQTNLPSWIWTDFEYTKYNILCSKCDIEHHDELYEKNEEIHNKHLVIEYMFDGDSLKYWEEGDEGIGFEEIEVDNDNGRSRYNKAIKEMKTNFPKTTKFIDVDSEY